MHKIHSSSCPFPRWFPVISLFLGIALYPVITYAEWQLQTRNDQTGNTVINLAAITNDEGYKLEIYRDQNDAVRSRFNLANGLTQLAKKSCPTYQIDQGMPRNRSIHDAACISGNSRAEFVLGYIENNQIASSSLLAVMDGIMITFRFVLENGDYRETRFSLNGSRSAITQAIGMGNKVIAAP